MKLSIECQGLSIASFCQASRVVPDGPNNTRGATLAILISPVGNITEGYRSGSDSQWVDTLLSMPQLVELLEGPLGESRKEML